MKKLMQKKIIVKRTDRFSAANSFPTSDISFSFLKRITPLMIKIVSALNSYPSSMLLYIVSYPVSGIIKYARHHLTVKPNIATVVVM